MSSASGDKDTPARKPAWQAEARSTRVFALSMGRGDWRPCVGRSADAARTSAYATGLPIEDVAYALVRAASRLSRRPRCEICKLPLEINGFLADLIGRGHDTRIRRIRTLVDNEFGELVGDVHVRAFQRLADDRAAATGVGMTDYRYRRADSGTVIVIADRNQSIRIANRYQREPGDFLLRSIRIQRQNCAALIDGDARQLGRGQTVLENRGRRGRLRELADAADADWGRSGRSGLPWGPIHILRALCAVGQGESDPFDLAGGRVVAGPAHVIQSAAGVEFECPGTGGGNN